MMRMRRMMTITITRRWRRSKRMRMRMASELSLESVPGHDVGDREWWIHGQNQCILPVLNDAAML